MPKPTEDKPIRRASAVEANKIAAGGKRLPGGVLSPEAAEDMDTLLDAGYALSRLQVIEKSLSQARKRLRTK